MTPRQWLADLLKAENDKRLVITKQTQGPLKVPEFSKQMQEIKSGVFIGGGTRPTGAGWMPIPGSKHGGYHRRKGGKWEYWYPDAETHNKHHGKQGGEKFRKKVDEKVPVRVKKTEDVKKPPKEKIEEPKKVKGSQEDGEKRKQGEQKPTTKRGAAHVVPDTGKQEISREPNEADKEQEERTEKLLSDITETNSMETENTPAIGNSAPKSPAIPHYPEYLPDITQRLPEELKNFPNPKGDIKRLYDHQIEGAERILTTWEKTDGVLLMDEAGLGKTNTAMAAILARGGKRNLVVVPTGGKDNLMDQWSGDTVAKLYNVDMKRRDDITPDKEGTFVVAYNDLLEPVIGPDGKIVKVTVGKGDKAKEKPVMKLRESIFNGEWDTVVFDESHNMVSHGKPRTEAALDLQDKAGKVLYMSATPFTNIQDMHYLKKLNMWDAEALESGEKEGFVRWAEKAGAKIDGKYAIKNIQDPKSELPKAAIAATMHAEGLTIMRTSSMEGVHSKFTQIKKANLSAAAKETMNKAEEIIEMAAKAGIDDRFIRGMASGWYKQFWEIQKVDHAIELGKKALAEGKQVAFFTHFKSFHHAHLKGFVKALDGMIKAASKSDKLDPALLHHRDDIAKKIAEMPKWTPATKRLVEAFGGSKQVAEIHGDTRKNTTDEQNKYQSGEYKVCVATMSKGGTGISLHDTKGDAPRVQINLTLPYTGKVFTQVAGRSHRLGSKSESEFHWMMGDDSNEKRIASVVAKRLISAGSLTSGNPLLEEDVTDIMAFENGTASDPDDLEKDIEDAANMAAEEMFRAKQHTEISVEGETAKEVVSHFEQLMHRYKTGENIIQNVGDELRKQRAKNDFKFAKYAAEKLRKHAGLKIDWRPSLGVYEIHGGYENLTKEQYMKLNRMKDAEAITYGSNYKLSFHVKPENMEQLADKFKVNQQLLTPEEKRAIKEKYDVSTDFDEHHKSLLDKGIKLLHHSHNDAGEPVYHITGTNAYNYQHGLKHLGKWMGYNSGAMITGDDKLKEAVENINKIQENKDFYNYYGNQKLKFGPQDETPVAPKTTEPGEVSTITKHHEAAADWGLRLSVQKDGKYGLTGNTYRHKDTIYKHGGKWNRNEKKWEIPPENFSRMVGLEKSFANGIFLRISHF